MYYFVRLSTRTKLLLGLALTVLFMVGFRGNVSAASSYAYPDDGDATHYLSVSINGGGINLNAPYSYLKAKYTATTAYHDVEITDGCWWANVDGGSGRPASCQLGQTEFFVCPSTASGTYDSAMKSDGRCFRADPGYWGAGGTGTQVLRFTDCNGSGCNAAAGSLDMPEVNGDHVLFIVAEMKVAGLNGFKVRTVARNSGLGEAGDTRVGLGGQMSTPLSLVHLPLGAGDTQFRAFFQVPCTDTSGSFQLGWFDADRPPSTTPLDSNISWTLYNQTSGQSITSAQMAFLSSQSEDQYLGANNEDRTVTLSNAGFFRVQAGDNYRFEWNGVNNNNGVQLKIPFDEADSGSACASSTCTFANAGPASVNVGASFTVVLRLKNGSGHNWTAATSTGAASGHKVGSESPRDNMTWGARRWLMPTINNGVTTDVNVTVTAPSTAGTYTLAFGVLSEGAHWESINPICSRSVTVNPPPTLTCPGQPNPPHYTITLPRTYNDPDYTGTIAWSAPSSTRHTTETRYNYHEDISDTNWGGGNVLPILVSQNPGNPGNVTLDYKPYQDEYPYDYNQPRVHYNDTYIRRHYYLGAAYWYPYYEWTYYPDPDGSGPKTAEWRYEFKEWRHGGYYVESYTTGPYSTSRNVDGPILPINGPPCFREYNSTITMGMPQLNPDHESPTSATMSATINIQFDTNNPDRGRMNMRQASRVNDLPFQFHYQIQRFGSAAPTATSGGWILNRNASVTILATSPARTATGAGTVAGNSVTVSVEQNASDLRVGDRVCWRLTVNQERGNINPPGNKSSTLGSEVAVACSQPVVNWPYLEVYGNDVVSGGNYTGGCNTGAPITTRFRNGQFRGSSTQYAVFAVGTINGFTSASLRQGASTAAQGPLGLTFSNMTATTYGGGYAANDGITCLPDYFGSRPDTTQATPNLNSQFTSPNADPNRIEYYEISGNHNQNGGPQIRDGVRKVFYINGTLNINTNIDYQNTAWNDRNNIPFVIFIARDINIAPGVTRLDGVYVAQPSGGGTGTINTCTTNYNACRNPLVINGAFVAQRVNFYRTRGSHRNSIVNEGRPGVVPGVGSNNRCSVPWGVPAQLATNTGAAGGTTCGAEVFSFSPEIYMSLSQILIPEESFKLDSYVTLPPNL